jgi:Sulfotransferase family
VSQAEAADGGARAPAPFVVGLWRSGTTLLRMMLDAHPDMAIPPETHFVPELLKALPKRARPNASHADKALSLLTSHRRWGDFGLDADELGERLRKREPLNAATALRVFYRAYARGQGKKRWGDKTPNYIQSMRKISRHLPEARFVHLIRDGRDAAISRRERAVDEPAGFPWLARRWEERILDARKQARRLEGLYLEIHYEELVTEPEATLREVCEFIELDYDPAMLAYHERAEERLEEMDRDLPEEDGKAERPAEHRLAGHELTAEPPRTDRIGRWRREMSPEDVAAFDEIAGDLLRDLGYEVEPAGARSEATRG